MCVYVSNKSFFFFLSLLLLVVFTRLTLQFAHSSLLLFLSSCSSTLGLISLFLLNLLRRSMNNVVFRCFLLFDFQLINCFHNLQIQQQFQWLPVCVCTCMFVCVLDDVGGKQQKFLVFLFYVSRSSDCCNRKRIPNISLKSARATNKQQR